ncbi:hypothetical protein TNCV_3539451 [Trichonephila clavipes]|nr:hypothetical protein TNCV_3539451 [Trichonephila clavipes]
MIESITNSNEFQSKDGTVVRIPDADFNIIPRSVTKNTIPCTTRIRTTTICVNNQGLIGGRDRKNFDFDQSLEHEQKRPWRRRTATFWKLRSTCVEVEFFIEYSACVEVGTIDENSACVEAGTILPAKR